MLAASAPRNGTRLAHWIALKAAFWVALALCLYLAFTPHPPRVAVEIGEVLAHLTAFAYLTVALFVAHFPTSNPDAPASEARYRALAVALWMFAVGVLIEVGQLFVAGRSSQFTDLGVDAAGIALGCAAYRMWEVARLRVRAA